MAADAQETERCPACQASGPPVPPSKNKPDAVPSTSTEAQTAPTSIEAQGPWFAGAQAASSTENTAEEEDETPLHWIACNKCSTWYHGACILLGEPELRETVPLVVRQAIEADGEWAEDGVWVEWVAWVDKWYCVNCLARARDPKNPRPPHHPLVAVLKKGCPPARHSEDPSLSSEPKNGKRSASMASSVAIKRRRTSRTAESVTPVPSSLADEINGSTSAPNEDVGDGAGSSRPQRQVAKKRPDYHALHNQILTPTAKWLDLIADPAKFGREIPLAEFPKVPANLVRREWLEGSSTTQNGDGDGDGESSHRHPEFPPSIFYGEDRQPFVIRPQDGGFEGLGGRIPGKDLTVHDVARLVSPDHIAPVIDVASQSSEKWPLSKWAEYVTARQNPSAPHSSSLPVNKVFNIISLEITGTELAKQVRPPKMVSETDWVDNFWNFGPGGKGNVVRDQGGEEKAEAMNGVVQVKEEALDKEEKEKTRKVPKRWPRVQLYCLMGVKGSWTDWHIDFAASSVYYTIHTGQKTFFFVKPTPKNLAAYTAWQSSQEQQSSVWLPDECEGGVSKVTLSAGDTMFIPAGWIHAVHTPADSIVFGGNFVHSYSIETQLNLRQIEIDTKVPQMFRFPFFDRLCWYVADHLCDDLRQLHAFKPKNGKRPDKPHARVLEGLVVLAEFLVSQADLIETIDAPGAKVAWDNVPTDIKDPSGLARELGWRARRELGMTTDIANGNMVAVNGTTKTVSQKPVLKTRTQLARTSRSRTDAFERPPWEVSVAQAQTKGFPVRLARPTVAEGTLKPESEAEVEDAEQVEHHHKESRRRVRKLEDGSIVVEEQEQHFVDRRITWPPAGTGNGVASSHLVAEHKREVEVEV